MKKMTDIVLTFNTDDLEKTPSIDCSFKEWVEWFYQNYDKVVDWNGERYSTEEYDD